MGINQIRDTELTIEQAPVPGTIISGSINTVTLAVSDDEGNSAEAVFNVSVVDTINPVISSTHNDQSIDADSHCEAELPDYTSNVIATDNCDAELSITQVPASGTILSGDENTISLSVADDAGNTAEISFNVEVIDVTDPVLPCAENLVVDAENQDGYVVSGTLLDPVLFGDNCGLASLVNDFNSQSSLDAAVFPVGTTTVTWTVTDESGNTTSCQMDVVVNPQTTGLRNQNTGTLTIYPNPVKNKIRIEIPGLYPSAKTMNVSIVDCTGKLCIHTEVYYDQEGMSMDISELENGIYYIRISDPEAVFTRTFVKR